MGVLIGFQKQLISPRRLLLPETLSRSDDEYAGERDVASSSSSSIKSSTYGEKWNWSNTQLVLILLLVWLSLSVIGFDIDPQSFEITTLNAEKGGTEQALS